MCDGKGGTRLETGTRPPQPPIGKAVGPLPSIGPTRSGPPPTSARGDRRRDVSVQKYLVQEMEGHRWRKGGLRPESLEETTSPQEVCEGEMSRSCRRPERQDVRACFDARGRAGQNGQRPRDRTEIAAAVGASFALRRCADLPDAAGRILRSSPGGAHGQTGDAHANQSDADQKDQRGGDPSLMVRRCRAHVSGGEQ